MLERIKKGIKNFIGSVNPLYVLIGTYVAFFILAPVLTNRIMNVFGLFILMGMPAMHLGFGVIDLINNNYGMEIARKAVLTAVVVRGFVWIYIVLTMLVPTQSMTAGFDVILKNSFRFMIAGWAGIVLSQYFIDIPIFHYIKEKIHKSFSIKYNLSNLLSSLISNIIFVTVAFIGTGKPIIKIIIGGYVIQMAILILLTPVIAGSNKLIQKHLKGKK